MSGQWIGASILLGRAVPVHAAYPHICGISMTGLMTGRPVRTGHRDCAACATTAEASNSIKGDDR